jgi:hypothetical protein
MSAAEKKYILEIARLMDKHGPKGETFFTQVRTSRTATNPREQKSLANLGYNEMMQRNIIVLDDKVFGVWRRMDRGNIIVSEN